MVHRGRVRTERSPKWIRVFLGGEAIADSRHVLLVWEAPYYPTYYFPVTDVRTDLLVEDGEGRRSPSRGTPVTYTIKAGSAEAAQGARAYLESPIEEIRDHIAFEWGAMDHWFEEDEEVHVHPRDPHTRVDVLHSSRRIRVEIDGLTVAESDHPALLFETGLPARYYLPKTDVRMDLLRPTETSTECPYKGVAEYWAVDTGDAIHPDIAWSYPFPSHESAKIAGRIAFYDEKVDLFVDGVRQPRPRTKFS